MTSLLLDLLAAAVGFLWPLSCVELFALAVVVFEHWVEGAGYWR